MYTELSTVHYTAVSLGEDRTVPASERKTDEKSWGDEEEEEELDWTSSASPWTGLWWEGGRRGVRWVSFSWLVSTFLPSSFLRLLLLLPLASLASFTCSFALLMSPRLLQELSRKDEKDRGNENGQPFFWGGRDLHF